MQLKCTKNEEQTGRKGQLKPWKWFWREERKYHSKGGGRVGITWGNNENPNAQDNQRIWKINPGTKKEKGGFKG